MLKDISDKINDLISKIGKGKTLPVKANETKKKVLNKTPVKVKSQVKKHPVIYRSENLPEYSSVVSLTDTLRLSKKLESEYIVLRDMNDDTKVYILCIESKSSLKIDNDFLQIKKRCSDQGYLANRLFTTKNIIDITYANLKKIHTDSIANKDNEGKYHEMFDSFLKQAIDYGSSDIIFSISGGSVKVKMRIKGRVKEIDELTEANARSLASVTYTSLADSGAKDTTFNERKPQDGIVNRIIDGQNVSVRLATVPAHPEGFDMTLRVMPVGTTQSEQKLTSLGYNEQQSRLIDYATTIPTGATVFAGVTGSGKTTTLATVIRKIVRETNGEKRVLTIEDPPEHRILDVTQIPVVRSNADSSEKSPFNAAMRASLRSDPDILMPGEIRDEESASLMIDATLSGHQVYTTVHAPSMFDILIRLRELGIKNSVLGSSSFISAFVYQSLVRTLCQNCAHTHDEYKSMLSVSDTAKLKDLGRILSVVGEGNISKVKFKNESGCSKCDFEGIAGREVIAEVMVPDRYMKTLFMEGKDKEALEYYKKSGGKFIVDHGIEKLIAGKVDLHDLEDKVGRIDMTDIPLEQMLKTFATEEDIIEASIIKESIIEDKEISEELDVNDKKNFDVTKLKSSLVKDEEKSKAKVLQIKARDDE